MRIIQSFWTLPILKSEAASIDNRFSGGWMDLKYHLMSWAYSCLQLRSFYDQVELITDRAGKALLIDQLQLPYTATSVVLDNINHYSPHWWAIGKIYAFGLQDKPFVHVDGDVFIWEAFPERLIKARLVAQNLEQGYPFYRTVMNLLLEGGHYIPAEILKRAENHFSIDAYNAGIIGGNDIGFFQEYVKEAWRFIKSNCQAVDNRCAGMINAFYEQHLYYRMAEKRQIPVECYTDATDMSRLNHYFKSLEQFEGAPAKCQYIHLFGDDAKKDPEICEELARRLRNDHPVYYHRLMKVVQKEQAKKIKPNY